MRVGIAFLLAIVVIIGGIFVASQPSDEDLIQRALDESIEASRKGQPGGVFEHLSRSFTYNEKPITSRGDVSRYINELRPDITLLDRTPQIDGSRATIQTDVHLSIGILNYRQELIVPNTDIELRRETGTRWGFLPSPRWRVVRVEAPGFDPTGLGLDFL